MPVSPEMLERIKNGRLCKKCGITPSDAKVGWCVEVVGNNFKSYCEECYASVATFTEKE